MLGKKRKILVLVAVASLVASLTAYAYGVSQVGNSKFSAIAGGVINSNGLFSVTQFSAVFCANIITDPGGPAAGPYVSQCSLPARGISVSSPNFFGSGFFVFNQLNTGDWYLTFLVTNTTDLPAGATWSVNFTASEPVGGVTLITLFVATTNPPSCTFCQAFLVFDLGPVISTPLAYTLTMQRVA